MDLKQPENRALRIFFASIVLGIILSVLLKGNNLTDRYPFLLKLPLWLDVFVVALIGFVEGALVVLPLVLLYALAKKLGLLNSRHTTGS